MPGMPGMPGVGKRAGARQQKKGQQKKGKRVSGNPAKRAQAAQQKPDPAARGADAFGFGGPAQGGDDFELPQELRDLL